jgi:predicted phage terminase large subunit-like protein
MGKQTRATRINELRALEERLRAIIRAGVRPFEDISAAAARARREACRDNPELFKRTYLPHLAVNGSATYMPLMHEMAATGQRILVITGFRGCAKTTEMVDVEYLMTVCYRTEPFVLVGSDTEDQATDIITPIRMELDENERILSDFGELLERPCRRKDFTANGVRVKARGHGQRVRGLRHHGARPTLVTIDDIEDENSAQSAKQTKKRLAWIKRSVIPGMDPGRWRVRVLGQRLHRKGVLAKLRAEKDDNDQPRHLSLNILPKDEAGDLTWPERFGEQVLAAIKAAIGDAAYKIEYEDQPANDEGLFPDEWFEDGRCDYRYGEINPQEMTIVIADDPSLGKPGGDPSAIIALGYHPLTTNFYVLDCFIDRVRPLVNAQMVGRTGRQYPNAFIAAETNLFAEMLEDPIKAECPTMAVLGVVSYLPKEIRIAKLSPLVQAGKIKFDRRRGQTGTLIDQLQSFGDTDTHDDGPDALEIGIGSLQRRLAGFKYDTVAKRQVYDAMEGY